MGHFPLAAIPWAPAAAALIAIVCAFGGVAMAGGNRARILMPASGLLLAAVAVFGLIPELWRELGWLRTAAMVAAGFGLLAALERLEERLAHSLVAATALHAFVDGWGMMAVANHGMLSQAVIAAMLLHKVPEGLALGAMLQRSSPRFALAFATLAELATVAGGAAGMWTAGPSAWFDYPLALAAGAFLFLGLHAQKGVICADGETAQKRHSEKHPGH